jgi:hypothetical protein
MAGRASRLLASAFGYRHVARDWPERLLHLRGRFRRSTSENLVRVATAAFAWSVIAYVIVVETSEPGGMDLRDPVLLAAMALLLAASVYVVWTLGRSYVFENGELRCMSWRGAVLWREDLRGLEHVTCGTNGAIALFTNTWLILTWPGHRRRIELFAALDSALSRQP